MKIVLFHPKAELFQKEMAGYDIDYETDFEKLKQNIFKYEGLIGFGLDSSLDLSNLKWIQSLAAGVDWLFENPTLNENTIITRVTVGLEQQLFEYTLARILYYYQNIQIHEENQKNHFWQRILSSTLVNKNILIIGTGKIGSFIGNNLHQLGMNVFGVNTTGYQLENFKNCYTFNTIDETIFYDIVVNILPSTNATNKIFNKDFFDKHNMDIFINIGRGNAVDTEVLVKNLNEDKIKMAFLDVFEVEPLDPKSYLWDMKNLHITTHIAGTPNISFLIPNIKNNLARIINKEQITDFVDMKKGY